MLTNIVPLLLPIAFSLFVTCALTTTVSALVLLLFQRQRLNQTLRHPYLQKCRWEALPWSLRATVLLDYFLRLALPRKTAWVCGDANRLLAHVVPDNVPGALKWPLYGLWVGCGAGLIAMLALWGLLLLAPS